MSGGVDADDAAAIKDAARTKGPRGKFSWLDGFFEFLSDSFRPILGALLGASLFITFVALMSTLNGIPNWADPREASQLSPTWQFINLCWQNVSVFLPLMVAYNAAKKLGADPWVGFAIMAVVMLPGFAAMKDFTEPKTVFGSQVDVVQVLGLPLTIFNYSSQVFPPLLMAAALGPLYKLLKRVIPENVQLIFVPFVSMLIMIPLTAFLIGPLGVYTGAALGGFLKSVNDFSPLIFAILIPLAYPFMVPLGLHWPINAIMLINIQTLGYDFIQGPMGAWNFACFGATAGVLFLAWRERDKQMRQTAMGGLAAGLLGGISEPSLYGIHLRFKRIYPRMLVGCLVGGVIIGLGGGVTTKAFVFTSILTIPAFSNMGLYALAITAAFVTSMVLVILSGYRTPEQAAAAAITVQQSDSPHRSLPRSCRCRVPRLCRWCSSSGRFADVRCGELVRSVLNGSDPPPRRQHPPRPIPPDPASPTPCQGARDLAASHEHHRHQEVRTRHHGRARAGSTGDQRAARSFAPWAVRDWSGI